MTATSETLSNEILQTVIGVVVTYRQDRAIREAMAEIATQTPNPLPIDESQYDAYILEARRRILLAARYDPEEELAVSITRLNELYAAAKDAGEVKPALDAQKELNKLQRLYAVEQPESLDDGALDEDEIRRAGWLRELEPTAAALVTVLDDVLEPALTSAGHDVPIDMNYTDVICMAAGQIKQKPGHKKAAKKAAKKTRKKPANKETTKKPAKKTRKKPAKKKT